MEELQIEHTSGQWRLLNDSSKGPFESNINPTMELSPLLTHWLKQFT
jgi:hypothetical protein